MSNQLDLVVEDRVIVGKQVKRLRQKGIVPANMYGHNQTSVPLQVTSKALQGVLALGGNNVILSLKLGNQPTVQTLIKKVQRNPVSGETIHVDFYRVAATETLKTHVPLHFINENVATGLGGVTMLRSLNEVMVECLPGDLPASIEVDLSPLKEVGAMIRVGNLTVGPGVTILTDHNDMVAGLHRQATAEKEAAPTAEEKTETVNP